MPYQLFVGDEFFAILIRFIRAQIPLVHRVLRRGPRLMGTNLGPRIPVISWVKWGPY